MHWGLPITYSVYLYRALHVVEKMMLSRDVVKNMTSCRDVVIIYHHMYIHDHILFWLLLLYTV